MKHCSNCVFCRKDLVAEYVKDLDMYKCDKKGKSIREPFWTRCELYRRDNFKKDSFGEIIHKILGR